MRTIQFLMAALMCLMMSSTCLAGDRIISPSQLPKAAKTYIQQNFKNQRIAYAQVDWDDGRKTYEVRLTNGIELKFTSRGALYKVDYEDAYYRPRAHRSYGHPRARVYDDDDDDYYDD